MAVAQRAVEDNYLAYTDTTRVLVDEALLVERHAPTIFAVPYHHHASVEANFLIDCEMEYSFSGKPVRIPENRLTIFWGAVPHCVTSVTGTGQIVNVYVSLSQLLSWKLPQRFVSDLIAGHVICSREPDPIDTLIFPRWAEEFKRNDADLRKILAGEAEMRIRRLAAGDWECLYRGAGTAADIDAGSAKIGVVEEMLRYIVDNYASSSIGVSDMAAHVQLSESYATTLFRKVTGISLKEHITRTRLSHAQMMLSTTDKKILAIAMDSGFGSLSAFYEAFQARMHQTPGAFRREARS
ncbi:helix-turn-helix domain-containing protein [Bauldia sp.]|uniref:helix-turn-helix domain-containing protein n=1 Tax=Bauldia sp. TaxID=2575872 RepID=UPI003BADB825